MPTSDCPRTNNSRPSDCGAHFDDFQVADKVRMLMRDDLDHEAVCVMARDRIVSMALKIQQSSQDANVWFELEYSRKGANDWYSSSVTADTEDSIRQKLVDPRSLAPTSEFEYRAVRKTLTTEVLNND